MTNHENEPYVTISLRHQPASPDAGNPEDAVAWEVVCRYCGDDPTLDHQEVPAELRRIRGPYPIKAGIATFLEHDELHGRIDTRTGRECGIRTLVLSVRSNWQALQARGRHPYGDGQDRYRAYPAGGQAAGLRSHRPRHD
jgi:hypothetical protein